MRRAIPAAAPSWVEREYALFAFARRPLRTKKRIAMIEAGENAAAFLRGDVMAPELESAREALAAAVMMIVDALDEIDGDPDLEDVDDCDLEPNVDREPDAIRRPNLRCRAGRARGARAATQREIETANADMVHVKELTGCEALRSVARTAAGMR